MAKNFTCKEKVSACEKVCDTQFASDLKVVSLYGRGQKGKTPTLTILINIMRAATSNFQEIGHRKKQANALDETCIFKHKTTGKVIGITTSGDMCYCLAAEFEWMKQTNDGKDCDLYVCASHLSGGTLNWLKARTKNGYLLRLSKATVLKEQGQAPNVTTITERAINTWQAEKLFEIVISLL